MIDTDYGDYHAWLERVGLSLINDEPDDLTSLDYPDVSQESAHAAEIPFDVDDDTDPTLRLECSICGATFATCECRGGPKKLWTPGLLPFEALNPKDADHD